MYILLLLFLGSWLGMGLTMLEEIRSEGYHKFWAATLENWQSEWLQLIFQAILLMGAKHLIFKVDAADMERLERKVDELLKAAGKTPEPDPN